MAESRISQLSGPQKAAYLLVTLGKDVTSEVFKRLSESEVAKVAREISNVRQIEDEVKSQVVTEFVSLQESIAGGVDFVREALERSMGQKNANKILESVTSVFYSDTMARPFEFLKRVDQTQLISILQDEQPQTIALILSYLPYEDAAAIITGLPAAIQAEVAGRIALMDQSPPDVVRQIETILKGRLETVIKAETSGETGGIKSVVEILNKVDRNTENSILETLEKVNPSLCEEIKNMMFVFEDIIMLDNTSIQRVLKDVDNKDLILALKSASEAVKQKIFKNMSERAVETIKEEMEYMGPVRVQQVEEAQTNIVRVIKRLEASEEIFIARASEENMFV